MYATVAAAAALHQVLLRSLGDDKVVVQNVASGLFCVLFVALGVVDRPSLLAASMLGYLISDSTCVTTASYAARDRCAPSRESPRRRVDDCGGRRDDSARAVLVADTTNRGRALLVKPRGKGAYDDWSSLDVAICGASRTSRLRRPPAREPTARCGYDGVKLARSIEPVS